jgi:hypothetical protein
MSLEYCRLVLDHPPAPGERGLIYLAETVGGMTARVVACSSVFHPDVNLDQHIMARTEIETLLVSDGWERVPNQPAAVVGLRFQRRTPVAAAI